MSSLFIFSGCEEKPTDPGTGGGGGGGDDPPSVNIKIKIANNTGRTIDARWFKASTTSEWGGYSAYMSFQNGQTIEISLNSNNKYDFRLSTDHSLIGNPSGFIFTKYNVTVSNGMTLSFTQSDLDNGDKNPSITIRNRSGSNFNSCYVRPSVSTDWGLNFGSINNNGDITITLPFQLSDYNIFDFQMGSSGATYTHNKSNVTITDGMIITIVSTDSNEPYTYNPVIILENNTGRTIKARWFKASTSSEWGGYSAYMSFQSGQSYCITLPQLLTVNSIYDFRLSTDHSLIGNPSGFIFTKYNVTVSNGMFINFTPSDLE
jgi:hypothetical protein